jgi:hypothetical protein
LKKRPPRAILVSKTRAASTAYNQIPCSKEQGIFSLEQGIFSREQGILRPDARTDPTPREKPVKEVGPGIAGGYLGF